MESLTKVWHGIFLAILFFSASLQAIQLETRHKPQGELRISLDFDLATRAAEDDTRAQDRRWVFSTYLVFKDSIDSITNGQLKGLAVDGWKEMQKEHEQYTASTSLRQQRAALPGVMTVMAFDNKIILASSQKGAGGFLDEFDSNPVSSALDICSRYWYEAHSDDPGLRNRQHMHEAKCGEVSAFWLYYQLPKEHPHKIGDLKPLARVTTVKKTKKGIVIIPPCGTDIADQWGCDLLVTKGEEVNYIMEDLPVESYDLKDLAGGVERISHISACTRDY